MNDWLDISNTRYYMKQTQLKRLDSLAEHLLQELAVRESSAFNNGGDKQSWFAGYYAALLDTIECIGEDYLPGSHELCMVTRGYQAADCLAKLREGRRKPGRK